MRRFAFPAGATDDRGALRAADRDPQRHRPHRDPRRGLGRRRGPPRRARQAPPRRPRLRRHDRPGAAAARADLLPLARALALCRGARGPRRASPTRSSQLLNEQVSVLVLADVGALDRETLGKVTAFVERGGVLLRFAGSRLAAGNDDLVPVRLRRGGRNLGGTLSWDTPRTFAPFTRESPFFGLPIPADLGVRRQILAEPDGDLAEKTWAALAGRHADRHRRQARRGPARPLPRHRRHDLVEPAALRPLRRHAAPDRRRSPARRTTSAPRPATPRRRRSRRGSCSTASAPTSRRRRPPARSRATTPSARRDEHPPGFYGPVDRAFAVNALATGDRLAPLDLAPLNARSRRSPARRPSICGRRCSRRRCSRCSSTRSPRSG